MNYTRELMRIKRNLETASAASTGHVSSHISQCPVRTDIPDDLPDRRSNRILYALTLAAFIVLGVSINTAAGPHSDCIATEGRC